MQKSLILIMKSLYHLTPLIPLVFFNNIITSVVFFLLIMMPYIKVKKISNQHTDAEKKGAPQLEEIRRSLAFWKAFTFLK